MDFDYHDMQQEAILWPWVDDPSYDLDPNDPANYDACYDCDESMDGDHETGLASAGYGTDEDYGCYGDETEY
jgi:hypothetical protein